MILRITDGGRGCVLDPEYEGDEPPSGLLLHKAAGSYYGSWREAIKFLRKVENPKVKGKNKLVQFLKWRKKVLAPVPTKCPTAWLNPEFSLRDYQKQSIRTFLSSRKLLLADDTGLGKTLTAIGAFSLLRKLKPEARALFFTLSPLRAQWYDEVVKFVKDSVIDDNEIALVTGDAERRRYFIEERRPLTILHYECVVHDVFEDSEGYLSGPLADAFEDLDMVVFDEAPRLKNPDGTTCGRVRALVDRVPYRLAISATPVKRDVEDLYGIFSVVDPRILGPYNAFSGTYLKWSTHKIGRGRNTRRVSRITASRNVVHLRKRIDYAYLRRTAKEVGEELPDLVAVPIWLDLDTRARKAYDKIRRSKDPKVWGGNRLVRARQFCCDPSIIGQRSDPTKTNKIIDLVRKDFADEQILIFSEFRTYAVMLFEKLKEEAGLFVGQMPDKRRQAYKDRFNRGDLRIIVGDSAMYEGGNLQTAGVIINADLPWVPSDLQQRAGRAQRIGATKDKIRVATLAYRDTVEENMLRKLLSRAKVFENLFAWEDESSPFEGLGMRELQSLL